MSSSTASPGVTPESGFVIRGVVDSRNRRTPNNDAQEILRIYGPKDTVVVVSPLGSQRDLEAFTSLEPAVVFEVPQTIDATGYIDFACVSRKSGVNPDPFDIVWQYPDGSRLEQRVGEFGVGVGFYLLGKVTVQDHLPEVEATATPSSTPAKDDKTEADTLFVDDDANTDRTTGLDTPSNFSGDGAVASGWTAVFTSSSDSAQFTVTGSATNDFAASAENPEFGASKYVPATPPHLVFSADFSRWQWAYHYMRHSFPVRTVRNASIKIHVEATLTGGKRAYVFAFTGINSADPPNVFRHNLYLHPESPFAR